jgi:hypothetical protein
MSKWVKQLESIVRKKELRPSGNWKTRLEVMDIIKCSANSSIKFLKWCEETQKIKKNVGTSLTCRKSITSKIFYKPLKKNWPGLYYDYAKSRQKLPEGKDWKTHIQLCREMKINQESTRRALSVLKQNNKLEIFKGSIVDQTGHITCVKFYRLKE